MYVNVLNELKATVSLKAYKIHDFPLIFSFNGNTYAEQYIEPAVITQFIIASISTNSCVIITQVKNRTLPTFQVECTSSWKKRGSQEKAQILPKIHVIPIAVSTRVETMRNLQITYII